MANTFPDGGSWGKQGRIVADLLDDILAGRVLPGERLPSNKALQVRFEVTGLTVSRAIRRLTEAGYLVSQERAGVFVAKRPPHLNRVGLVMEADPQSLAHWGPLEAGLSELAAAGGPDGAEFEVYHSVDRRLKGGVEVDRLADDVAARRIGGVIFAQDPWRLAQESFMLDPTLVRLGIFAPRPAPGLRSVRLRSSESAACARFADLGCARVAAICPSSQAGDTTARQRYRAAAAAAGLAAPLPQRLYADVAYPASAAPLVALLMALPPESRPDALLVGDARFLTAIETALLALAAPGAVPGAAPVAAVSATSAAGFPAIIVQGFLPLQRQPRLPVHWLGHDLRTVLDRCLAVVRQLQSGEDPQDSLEIAPRFAAP